MKPKDIRKSLGTWNYIKATGRVIYAMPKNAVAKIKQNYKNAKSNFKDYVKKEAAEKVKDKQKNVQGQIHGLYALKKEMKKDKAYTHGAKKAYLLEVDKKIKKLKEKKKNIKSKGLGIFALSALALKKYREKRKEERLEIQRLKEEERIKLKEEQERLKSVQKLQEAEKLLSLSKDSLAEQEQVVAENERLVAELRAKLENKPIIEKEEVEFVKEPVYEDMPEPIVR